MSTPALELCRENTTASCVMVHCCRQPYWLLHRNALIPRSRRRRWRRGRTKSRACTPNWSPNHWWSSCVRRAPRWWRHQRTAWVRSKVRCPSLSHSLVALNQLAFNFLQGKPNVLGDRRLASATETVIVTVGQPTHTSPHTIRWRLLKSCSMATPLTYRVRHAINFFAHMTLPRLLKTCWDCAAVV